MNPEDIHAYRLVQERLKGMEKEVAVLQADTRRLEEEQRGVRADLRKWSLVTIGDDELGYPGLIDRMASVEAQAASGRRLMMMGLAITSLTGLATFGAILFQIVSR